MSNITIGNNIKGARYWWLQVLRGTFALGLGLSLLGSLIGISLLSENFATTNNILLFIGMFWLTTGLMSYLWGTKVAEDPGHWWKIAMVISIWGGLFVILRAQIDDYINPNAVKDVLALFFFLNGLMHILGVHKNPEDNPRLRLHVSPMRLSFYLGLVEIVMALVLAFFWEASSFIDTLVIMLAITWSGISGISLVYRGVKLRGIWKYQNLTN